MRSKILKHALVYLILLAPAVLAQSTAPHVEYFRVLDKTNSEWIVMHRDGVVFSVPYAAKRDSLDDLDSTATARIDSLAAAAFDETRFETDSPAQ